MLAYATKLTNWHDNCCGILVQEFCCQNVDKKMGEKGNWMGTTHEKKKARQAETKMVGWSTQHCGHHLDERSTREGNRREWKGSVCGGHLPAVPWTADDDYDDDEVSGSDDEEMGGNDVGFLICIMFGSVVSMYQVLMRSDFNLKCSQFIMETRGKPWVSSVDGTFT